jgi:hypothetical protein
MVGIVVVVVAKYRPGYFCFFVKELRSDPGWCAPVMNVGVADAKLGREAGLKV